MKKLFVIVLCLTLALSVQGCGKAEAPAQNSNVVIHRGTTPPETLPEETVPLTTAAPKNKVTENKVGSVSSEKEPETLEIGSVIEADWVQIHLDEIEISDIILPADTSGVHLYIDDVAGKQYVCLRGTLKNLSSVNLDSDEMGGKVVINDTYEYDIEMSIGANPAATTDYLLEPLGTSHFYIYANVPDDALALMKTGYMLLDFNENFGVTNGTGDYYYRIDFTK